jgi:colanic acid/amylovoran biosynthesis glycosyltransferase
MRVAYLVNQYPKISNAFIRREILEVESQGCEVARYSLRRIREDLLDPMDRAEAAKTKVVLDAGMIGLLLATVRLAIRRPIMFLRALSLGVRVGLRSERGLLLHGIYLAEACVLILWFARDRIEHVHAHFGTNSTTVAMLCRALGGPSYSFTAHGPEEFDKALLLGLGHKIERASFVAAISSFGRSQLFRRCRIPHWPKIDIIRCGVDASFLNPTPTPLPAQRRLVSIGRLSEQKGQILLVDAISRLRQSGRTAELVLIGDGILRPDIEAAIARNGLETQVRLLGWADSATIRRTLDESCALVLPSFAEGLPVVIMEAMARARPIVSTYVAGIPELVVPGRNGWLVPAGSVEALVEALCKVLDTPLEELTRMGMCGREDVRRQHEIGIPARRMVAKFREIIESRHSQEASTS